MARLVRGLFLTLLLVLGQTQASLALVCESHPAQGASRAEPGHAGHEGGRSELPPDAGDEPRPAPSCSPMASCMAVAALPASVTLLVGVDLVTRPVLSPLLSPASRSLAPANPPPKA